ncbi:MAG: erythromycin esterase family protein, partial [Bacteroidota bacterium]
STHGVGEFYELKSKLIEYLYTKLDFNLIIFESGFADINLAWDEVVQFSPQSLRDTTLFGNFQCQEIAPLFELIKEKSKQPDPLYYSGVDVQSTNGVFKSKIKNICSVLSIQADVENDLGLYFKMYREAYNTDSTKFIQYRDSYMNLMSQMLDEIVQNKNTLVPNIIPNDFQFQVIKRHVESQISLVNFDYSDRFTDDNSYLGFVIRDSLMFENFKWIQTKLYPDEKIILWGHNSHIEKGYVNNRTSKWLGNYISQHYGDEYYSLGMFVYEGDTRLHWNNEIKSFKNAGESNLESLMLNNEMKFSFVSTSAKEIPWLNSEVIANEFENGEVTFVPHLRFDGLLTIPKGSVPEYE